MSGIYAAIAVGAGVTAYGSYRSSKEAASAAGGASEAAMQSALNAAGIEANTQRYAIAMQAFQQQQALDYLKEADKLPRGYREAALQALGEEYGFSIEPTGAQIPGAPVGVPPGGQVPSGIPAGTQIPGATAGGITTPFRDIEPSTELVGGVGPAPRASAGETSSIVPFTRPSYVPEGGIEGEYIPGESPLPGVNITRTGGSISERARTSPFFTTARDIGEEAVMRQAPMTGGLRSGNVQDALARSSQDLYLQSYLRELQGLEMLSGLPSGASEIAMSQRGIGETYGGYADVGSTTAAGVREAGGYSAAGITAAEQARQAGYQGVGTAITGGVQNLLYARGQGLI